MLSFLLIIGIVTSMFSCQSSNNEAESTKVILSDNAITLAVGDIHTLEVSVTPTSTQPVVWSSSNNDVATVFYGKITAKSVGTSTITAECNGIVDSCVVNITISGENQEDETIGEYSLVWSDEFNGTTLNKAVWNIEVNGDGGGNNELQYYRAENVSVGEEPISGKGCLILTARKENYGGKTATSGRINSRDNVTFTHGMIEASIRIPHTANGIWPAFWMMGNDISSIGWPKCGEIDIMEMGHSNGINAGTPERFFNGACHWAANSSGTHVYYANDVTAAYDMQNDFTTFRCYWDDKKITMYLDQDKYPDVEPYFVMDISETSDATKTGYYFHKPNFILFNLAVGGNFPSIWDINQVTALNNGDVKMYVDYVRVYQRGLENETLNVK